MSAKKEELSFEEALKKLEEAAETLRKPGTTLEEAIKSYEEGIEYCKTCEKILNSAKQKIEVYNEESGVF